jgi:adenylate kinase family enzyme
VPLFTATYRLPGSPRRVLVAGTSGSGKTTLARRIATVLGAPHVEIDALFHGPGWSPRPTFVTEVERFVAWPAWVTEWQYSQVRPVLAAAADLMVWLDLRRPQVMWQVTRRTLERRWHRELLWNSVVEPPLRTVFTDPEHIVRWAWRTHGQFPARIRAVLDDRPELPVVRLTGHAAASAWVRGPLAAAAGQPVSGSGNPSGSRRRTRRG